LGLFFLLDFERHNCVIIDVSRSSPRGLVLFLQEKSDQNPTAASDAMKGCAWARLVIAAPADAEEA